MSKRKILLTVLIAMPLLFAAYYGYAQWKKEWRDRQNVKFDELERVYGPSSIDLRGKNVLSFKYNSFFNCDDACEQLLKGTSGAQVFYAFYDFPDAPDFSAPLDLTKVAQGRVVLDDEAVYGHSLIPFAPNEAPPKFDYVLSEMPQAITPVLTAALSKFDLAQSMGTAHRVLSPVPNQTAFRLDHETAHFIQFHRDGAMGRFNSWQGGYNFSSRINRTTWYEAVERMFCGPEYQPKDGLSEYCVTVEAQ